MSEDHYTVVTHYVTAKGLVIMHAYGLFPTRAKADTLRKRLLRRAQLDYTPEELLLATVQTAKIDKDRIDN